MQYRQHLPAVRSNRFVGSTNQIRSTGLLHRSHEGPDQPHGDARSIDPSLSLRASPAIGLVGFLENSFIAACLQDLNSFIPLTTESAVMQGMLEVDQMKFASSLFARPGKQQHFVPQQLTSNVMDHVALCTGYFTILQHSLLERPYSMSTSPFVKEYTFCEAGCVLGSRGNWQ
jgi:hypothetical protein